MNIKDIDFSSLEIEREYKNSGIYSRTVYFDSKSNKYIKIWNKDFFYKKHFINAFKVGYYNDISLLEDIIENDEKKVLGYIISKEKNVNFECIDNNKYRDLINRMVINSNKYNIIYLDLNPTNIVEKNNKYYIIDLEASVSASCLKEINNLKSILEYNNYFYLKSISNLLSSAVNINNKIKVVKHNIYHKKEIKYSKNDGRIFLEKEYLPTLNGKILFIGVNYYTDFYHQLVKNPDLFETLDINEKQIENGSPYKHYICNILDFKEQGYLYDHVCMFGVMGHEDDWDIIQKEEDIIKCINVLDSLVKKGGTLLLGPGTWSRDMDFWDNIYKHSLFTKYKLLLSEKIGRNIVWYGEKI